MIKNNNNNLCVHFTINCGKTIKILFFVFVCQYCYLIQTNQFYMKIDTQL